jgi:hypothetical protein
MPNVPAITVTGLPSDLTGGEYKRSCLSRAGRLSNPHFGLVTLTVVIHAFLRFIAQRHLSRRLWGRDGLESDSIWSHLPRCRYLCRAFRHFTCHSWSPDKQIFKLDPVLPVLRSFGTARGCNAQRTQDRNSWEKAPIDLSKIPCTAITGFDLFQTVGSCSASSSMGTAGPTNSGNPDVLRMTFSISRHIAGFSFSTCLAFSRPWANRSPLYE